MGSFPLEAFLNPEKPGWHPEAAASPATEPAGSSAPAFTLEMAVASESIFCGSEASLLAWLWEGQEALGERPVAEDRAGLGAMLTREYFFRQVVALAWPAEKSREGCWP